MAVNLRNTSGVPLTVAGRTVDVDEVIHVEGSLAKKQYDDAFVIGTGDDAAAYPHALWTNAGGSKNAEPDVTKENS